MRLLAAKRDEDEMGDLELQPSQHSTQYVPSSTASASNQNLFTTPPTAMQYQNMLMENYGQYQ